MRLFTSSSQPKTAAKPCLAAAFALLLGGSQTVSAIALDPNSADSYKQASSIAAVGLIDWYIGNETGNVPGNLPSPYYWWEAGAMMMSLIDYWHMTGDDQYNGLVSQAIQWQRGENDDFMTQNQTRTTGNDDQAFWAFAALNAAEFNFPAPPPGGAQYLALAQAVFNEMVARWQQSGVQDCDGGLRWQIFPFNDGWNYKNSIANGCFFNLAARLYRYTGNETFADWAQKVWTWETTVGFMSPSYEIFDGANINAAGQCPDPGPTQWTYNAGVWMHGAANMYNATNGAQQWLTYVNGILTNSKTAFFKDGIMYEWCEYPTVSCDPDQLSFKAYLASWMAKTAQLVPPTVNTIMPLLQSTAVGAAAACTGSNSGAPRGSQNGEVCPLNWASGATYDGLTGPGEQMSAMSVFYSNLVLLSSPPYTAATGGNSKGDPNAGSSSTSLITIPPATTGDRIAAAILTLLVVVGMIAGTWWIAVETSRIW